MIETTLRFPIPQSVALLSDLHNRPFHEIFESLSRRRPSVICIAGDVIYGGKPRDRLLVEVQENVLPFLRMCGETAPSFLSLGNHELSLCEEDLDRIRATGVTVLDNAWTVCGDLRIGGLTSHRVLEYRHLRAVRGGRYPVRRKEPILIREPELGWLEDFEQQPGFRLLLCHHPEYYPLYLRDRSLDLILSGHAHGGQWRFFGRGVYAPDQGLFPKYTSGLYDGRLFVGRGLSNPVSVPRLNNPPEVVYIEPLNPA